MTVEILRILFVEINGAAAFAVAVIFGSVTIGTIVRAVRVADRESRLLAHEEKKLELNNRHAEAMFKTERENPKLVGSSTNA